MSNRGRKLDLSPEERKRRSEAMAARNRERAGQPKKPKPAPEPEVPISEREVDFEKMYYDLAHDPKATVRQRLEATRELERIRRERGLMSDERRRQLLAEVMAELDEPDEPEHDEIPVERSAEPDPPPAAQEPEEESALEEDDSDEPVPADAVGDDEPMRERAHLLPAGFGEGAQFPANAEPRRSSPYLLPGSGRPY